MSHSFPYTTLFRSLEGILFTDKLSAFKKQLLKGKLARITKGDVKHEYRMRFPR